MSTNQKVIPIHYKAVQYAGAVVALGYLSVLILRLVDMIWEVAKPILTKYYRLIRGKCRDIIRDFYAARRKEWINEVERKVTNR